MVGRVLNSRPLTYGDEEQGELLTQFHVMIGKRILDRPSTIEDMRNSVAISNAMELTRRVKQLKTVLDHFRSRFRREYLTELREHQRCTRKRKADKINVGDVVTVFEDKMPPQRWILGRIEKLLRSSDGEICSAILRINRCGERLAQLEDRYRNYIHWSSEKNKVQLDEYQDGDYQDQNVITIEPAIKFVAYEEESESVDNCL